MPAPAAAKLNSESSHPQTFCGHTAQLVDGRPEEAAEVPNLFSHCVGTLGACLDQYIEVGFGIRMSACCMLAASC